jgi:hypothetical protein
LRETVRKLLRLPPIRITWEEALDIALTEGKRRGWHYNTVALNKGLRDYVILMNTDGRGRTLKLWIGVSDGAMKKATTRRRVWLDRAADVRVRHLDDVGDRGGLPRVDG